MHVKNVGKFFFQKSIFYCHKVFVHLQLKSFKCDDCEFVCSTVSNLNLHRKYMHKYTDHRKLSQFNTSCIEICTNKYDLKICRFFKIRDAFKKKRVNLGTLALKGGRGQKKSVFFLN